MAKIRAEAEANNAIYWTVTLKGDDRMIGDISFWRIMKEHSRAEIGYSFVKEFHGRGLLRKR
jgi:ribosomal-protein-alanine N-acetyltransferase